MKPTKILCIVLALVLLTAPIFVIRPTHAALVPGAPVFYAISFSQTDWTVSTKDIPPPTVPGLFNVSIWLVNATVANAPAGISSVEVHVNITQLMAINCNPIGFDDRVGKTGGVLQGATGLLALSAGGYYDAANEAGGAIPFPYTGANEYVVVESSSGNFWNNDTGLVAIMMFNCTSQPPLGDPANFATVTWNGAGLVDGDSNDVDYDLKTAELTVEAAPPPSYVIPSTYPAIYFDQSIYDESSASLGDTFNVTVMIGNNHGSLGGVDPGWDVAGFDVAVTWNDSLVNIVGASQGGFLKQSGAETQGLSGGLFTDGFAITYSGGIGTVEGVFTKTTNPAPSQGIDSLVELEFSVIIANFTVPVTDIFGFVFNDTMGFYMPDLASWAHSDRVGPNEPWNGSITAVDLGPPTTPISAGSPSNGGYFYVGVNAVYKAPYHPLGPMIDLYDQYYIATPGGEYGGMGQGVHSDAFAPQDRVCLTAKVTYAGYRVVNKLVVFEIHNAQGNKVALLQGYTGQDGTVTVCFRIPQTDHPSGPEDPDLFGWWQAIATVSLDGVPVMDHMWFQVGWLVTVNSVTVNAADYIMGGHMSFTMTVTTISEMTFAMRAAHLWAAGIPLFSIDVFDAQSYPIGEIAWTYDVFATRLEIIDGPDATTGGHYSFGPGVDGVRYDVNNQVAYVGTDLVMPIPTWGRVGIATVYGLVLSSWPRWGGTPLGMPASNTFNIAAPP